MQIWFTNKFINIGQTHNFSHSLSSVGSNNTYQKLLSIQIHLLWKILRLSLVSKLHLNLCLWYSIFSFLLGFDRLFILTLPLWYTISTFSFIFIQYIPLPPPSPLCLLYRRFVPFKWLPQNRPSPWRMTVKTKKLIGSTIKPALLRAKLHLFLNLWGP